MRGTSRTLRAAALASTTVALLAVAAGPAMAVPAPLPIANGNFATPSVTNGPQSYLTNAIPNWNITTETYSNQMCQRTDGLQCMDLNSGSPQVASQQLINVKKGDAVVITFETSPNTWSGCGVQQLAAGQPFSVGATGTPTQQYRANGVTTTQTASWSTQTYSFTATQNAPTLSFISQDNGAGGSAACGPLIANVTATDDPTPNVNTVPIANPTLAGGTLAAALGAGYLVYRRRKAGIAA
ncbi:DUF642 domain-containing protein [Kitasatospora sp. LaBMicrA B282]|uniref:DUF642 domain-containing protein n=1 Tax=Kitasatospora sp. LaBMicrA B282 TaxID=3420949 RepID=UPI003D13FB42